MDYATHTLYPQVQDLTEAEYSYCAAAEGTGGPDTAAINTNSQSSCCPVNDFSLRDLLHPTSDYPQSISSIMPSMMAAGMNPVSANQQRSSPKGGGHNRGRSLFNFTMPSLFYSSNLKPPGIEDSSASSDDKSRNSNGKPQVVLHRRYHSSPTLGTIHDDTSVASTSEYEPSKEFVAESIKFDDAYVLTRQIYRCNVSSIWECVSRDEGTRHCVKIIDRRRFATTTDYNYCGGPNTREESSALQEIAMMTFFRSYSTSQLMNATHVSEDLHHYYIVMDLVDGTNLANYCILLQQQQQDQKEHDYDEFGYSYRSAGGSGPTMTESQVQQLARSLLTAVRQLHYLGICHYDIQPENLLLKHNRLDQVVLCDFGSSRFINDRDDYNIHSEHSIGSDSSNRSSSSQQQQQKQQRTRLQQQPRQRGPGQPRRQKSTLGACNLNYAAPEVFSKRRLNHNSRNHMTLASDMWSIGVIIYQCLCGSLPFDDHIRPSTNGAHYSTNAGSTRNISIHSGHSGSSKATLSSRGRLKENIINANYSFARKEWKFVTRSAKQFISTLLHPDPNVRMTVDEALEHTWLTKETPPLLVSAPTSSTTSSKSSSRQIKSKHRRSSLMKRVLGTITKRGCASASPNIERRNHYENGKDGSKPTGSSRDMDLTKDSIDLNTASTLSSVASMDESSTNMKRRQVLGLSF